MKPIRMLENPMCYFSKDFSRYTQVYDIMVEQETPFFWEYDCLFVYVCAGEGRAIVNQTPYLLTKGSFGELHSFHVFRFESTGPIPLHLKVLTYPYPEMLLLDVTPLEDTANGGDAFYMQSPFVSLKQKQIQIVETLLASFPDENASPDPITPLMRNCLFQQLSDIFIQERAHTLAPPLPLCAKVLLYVAAHSFTPLNSATVAAEFSIKEAQVNQELRQVCGNNLGKALNHSRLSNAYSMMLRTDLSLSSISQHSGFSTEASFYRIFQDTHRMTPKEYRSHVLEYLGGESRNYDDRLLEIESYVLNNFREPITPKSCANELFLTIETINQVLHDKYGGETSFRTFVTTMRLLYAEGLLTMTELPVCDVALDAGFNSIHTFIRLFKQRYHMTPTEYRRNQEAQQ